MNWNLGILGYSRIPEFRNSIKNARNSGILESWNIPEYWIPEFRKYLEGILEF